MKLPLQNILNAAFAEVQITRRLARFWTFSALAAICLLVAYIASCIFLVHAAPEYVPFVTLTPQHLLSNIDPLLFLALQMGLLFLVFDVKQRDVRNRIEEVLHAKPISNFELLCGRTVGIAALLWMVVASLVLSLYGFGLLAKLVGWDFAAPIQLHSIANLLVVDVPALLFFWGSLVVFLGSYLHSRIVVLAISLTLMYAACLLASNIPFAFLELVSPSSNATLFISDVVPEFASPHSLVIRLGAVLAGIGLIAAAAILSNRRDGSSWLVTPFVMCALLGTSGISYAIAAIGVDAGPREIAKWRSFHDAYKWHHNFDINEIAGTVSIQPGKRLDLDLQISLRAVETPVNNLALTFNPGMVIQELEFDGNPVNYTFANGLLEIDPNHTLSKDTLHVLTIKSSGIPNARFGYFNSAVNYLNDRHIAPHTVKLFGTDASIFQRNYVALMPGSFWYPVPGPVKTGYVAGHSGADHFDLNVLVELDRPNWSLVASANSVKLEDGRFELHTSDPVSQIGLMASEFYKAEIEVDGLEFAVFLHDVHRQNLQRNDNLQETIRSEVERIVDPLAKNGLTLPNGFLYLVEIPSRLRTVGGGWRMDLADALPGVVLMKEHSFPTAPLHHTLAQPSTADLLPEVAKEMKVRSLFLYFQLSIGTDNPWSRFPHRFFNQLTSASGEHAVALDQIVNAILSQPTFTWDFFSIHSTLHVANMSAFNPISSFLVSELPGAPTGLVHHLRRLGELEENYGKRPSVWDYAEQASLASLPTQRGNQHDIELLLFKSQQIANGLLTVNGREKVLTWLADVRSTFAGSAYTYADLIEFAIQHDVVIDPMLTEWLTEPVIPGYVVSQLAIDRIVDDDTGNPRYQTSFDIRNVQPVSGYVQVNYSDSGGYIESEAVRIDANAAKRLTVITSVPPTYMHLNTGLSLNRSLELLDWNSSHEIGQLDAKPQPFATDVDWIPEDDAIVVDDLDPGFRVAQVNPQFKNTTIGSGPLGLFENRLEVELDAGLPTWSMYTESRMSDTWQRAESPAAFGKYRKTFAAALVRRNVSKAIFSADLPESGKWRLDYHSISNYSPRDKTVYALAAANLEQRIEFEVLVRNLSVGWNSIETFELDRGRVELELFRVTSPDGPTSVFADAIRWTKVDSN